MNRNVEQWQVYKKAVQSERGVVGSQHWLAAQAGAGILAEGGNAVDAAVATALALNAVEPWMCGLGGSGFMVIWLAESDTAHVVNFQGTLAQAIDLADYPLDPSVPGSIMGFPGVVDDRNVTGYGAITVPGAVAGLSEAQARFGRLSFDTALKPAIDLAERGLPVDWHGTLQIALEAANLMKDPEAAKTYLPGGAPLGPEQYRVLGKLPETLRRLADHGPRDFYEGELAERMVGDLQAGGSRIAMEDLAAYRAEVHEPLSGTHRGATIHTAGETSGGVRMLEALGHIEEALDVSQGIGAHTYLTYADALNKAFATHKRKLGVSPSIGCTSHLSTLDADGNMVALTHTLLSRFGAKVMLPSTGMMMNNSVSYFDPRPGFPTTMEGGKRINSSNMCPAIAVRDGKPLFAVGASGANHIVPGTMQVAAFMLDYGVSLEEAFNTPRIDASDRGSIGVDPAVGPEIIAALEAKHELELAQMLVFPKFYSCPSGVMHDAARGLNYGISDKSQPVAGAAAEAPFVLDSDGTEGEVGPRA